MMYLDQHTSLTFVSLTANEAEDSADTAGEKPAAAPQPSASVLAAIAAGEPPPDAELKELDFEDGQYIILRASPPVSAFLTRVDLMQTTRPTWRCTPGGALKPRWTPQRTQPTRSTKLPIPMPPLSRSTVGLAYIDRLSTATSFR